MFLHIAFSMILCISIQAGQNAHKNNPGFYTIFRWSPQKGIIGVLLYLTNSYGIIYQNT